MHFYLYPHVKLKVDANRIRIEILGTTGYQILLLQWRENSGHNSASSSKGLHWKKQLTLPNNAWVYITNFMQTHVCLEYLICDKIWAIKILTVMAGLSW